MAKDEPITPEQAEVARIEKAEVQKQWLERAHAVERTQATYLWTTLVAAIFFFALRYPANDAKTVNVPVIGLDLKTQAVLASGPFILALLVVATIGSMKAWHDAIKQYAGEGCDGSTDRLDHSPNVLDLAHYATRPCPLLDDLVFILGYPGCMGLVVFESAWLLWWLWSSNAPGRIVFIVLTVPFLLGAAILVILMVFKRIKGVLQKRVTQLCERLMKSCTMKKRK